MTSRQYCVVGSPISHSLSPNIHNAAYDFLGLDWQYSRQEVQEGGLESFITGSGQIFSGISVTMPLKLEAARLATRSDEVVNVLGVANTLINNSGELLAFNTDVFGITKALESCFQTGIRSVAILGAGATATSALYAVHLNAPEASVNVFSRNVTRTEGIAELAQNLGIAVNVKPLDSYSNEQELTISTIPSSSPATANTETQSGWLLNVNYSDNQSSIAESFMKEKVVNGQTMLVWQAIAQVRLFLTGQADSELPNENQLFLKMVAAL